MSKLILLFFISPTLAFAHQHQHMNMKTEKAQPSGESIYQLKSRWQNQNGQEVELKSLAGKPAILAMAYTSCQASCPFLVEDMKKIEADLDAKGAGPIQFAFFSFDPKRDTPEKLKSYAKLRHLNTEHWSLFHGGANSVRELAAVLGLRYKQDENGDFDHSNVIFLLDKDGVVRSQQLGLKGDAHDFEQKALELLKTKS